MSHVQSQVRNIALHDSQELKHVVASVRTEDERAQLWEVAAGMEHAEWRRCQQVMQDAEAAIGAIVQSTPRRDCSQLRRHCYAAKDGMGAAHEQHCRKVAAVCMYITSQECPEPLRVRAPAVQRLERSSVPASTPPKTNQQPKPCKCSNTAAQTPKPPPSQLQAGTEATVDALLHLLCALSHTLQQMEASEPPVASEDPQPSSQRSTLRRRPRGKGGSRRVTAPSEYTRQYFNVARLRHLLSVTAKGVRRMELCSRSMCRSAGRWLGFATQRFAGCPALAVKRVVLP